MFHLRRSRMLFRLNKPRLLVLYLALVWLAAGVSASVKAGEDSGYDEQKADVRIAGDSLRAHKIKATSIDPAVKQKFDALTAEWKKYLSRPGIGYSSDSKTYTSKCPAYQGIVALGEPAIPCIMEQYLKPSTWDWWHNQNQWWQLALEDITGIGRNRPAWSFDKSKAYWSDWWLWQQSKLDNCPTLEDYDPPMFPQPNKK